ncbi:MAG: hypothetical protein MJ231_00470 [bacterium]|nr:hypothetical protein [bacterium]
MKGFIMPKVNVIDSINHSLSLINELTGKGIAEKTEIAIRETIDKVADKVLSKEASDAIKSSVSAQIKTIPPVFAIEMETARFKTANAIGYLIKESGFPQTFVDSVLYEPLYRASLRIQRNGFPERKDIDFAFKIINEKTHPEKIKDTAAKTLSDLATVMKKTEQELIAEQDAKRPSCFNLEELLKTLREDMDRYKKRAEKMVNSGKLEFNPFV